jgi:NADH:ubiquinone oxidoreductase subunit E
MLKIKVCAGSHCVLKGSLEILEYLLDDELYKDKIEIESTNCMNHVCIKDNTPIVEVDGEIITNANLEKVYKKIGEKLK